MENKAYILLKQALDNKYALGAFNVSNIETLKAVTNAAFKLKAPIILEASEGEINYIGYKQLVSLVNIYKEELGIDIILNLDHAKRFEDCKKAIDEGFDYVHIDGSTLDYETNVSETKKVVEYAHKYNILVEGEMDHIQGSSEDHTREDPSKFSNEKQYSDSQKAYTFVSETGIDVFAGFFGNLHGVYSKETRLNFDVLSKLKEILPSTFLSLHGGSGINNSDVKKAIQMGIVKVNVNSEMRIAFKNTLKQEMSTTDEIAIYKITPKAIQEVEKIVENKIILFGTNKVTTII